MSKIAEKGGREECDEFLVKQESEKAATNSPALIVGKRYRMSLSGVLVKSDIQFLFPILKNVIMRRSDCLSH